MLNSDYLKVDYIVAYKRMKFLSILQNIFDKKAFEKYKKISKIYSKNIKLKKLNKRTKVKFLIIKFCPIVYYLKIILKKEVW